LTRFVRLLLDRTPRKGVWRALFVAGAAVGTGYWAGLRPAGFFGTLRLVMWVSLSGLILQFAGLFVRSHRKSYQWSVPQFVYNLLLVHWGPQQHVGNSLFLLVFIGLLTPLVVGSIISLNRGAWLSGIGGALLLFAGTLSMTWNAQGRSEAGIGFVSGWIS
jgi:hypothetical protein